MAYRRAGMDVHKKMLAVVVSDVKWTVSTILNVAVLALPRSPAIIGRMVIDRDAEEVVMESTAQYRNPVCAALERYWKPISQKQNDTGPSSGTLHLAQAQSNRGRRGRTQVGSSRCRTSGNAFGS